jgi:polysaccharide export outer membrane protein
MFRNLVCLVAATLALAACSSENAAIAKLPPGAAMGAADATKAPVTEDYRLWPQDIVQIEVFNMPALSRATQLDSSGNIDVPLLGTVSASGKTAHELAEKLRTAYAEKYLQNPQINVAVKQARVETITVDGSVQQPGVFQVVQQTSLIRAIAMARGLDQMANPKQVVVFRNVKNERVAGLFDLQKIRSGQEPDPAIYPNDTIVVASSTARRTLRDILGVTPLVNLIPLVP